MNIFIVSVKFLGWRVAIWVRLTRLIGENGRKYKNKIENYYKKKKLDPRTVSRAPPGFVPGTLPQVVYIQCEEPRVEEQCGWT